MATDRAKRSSGGKLLTAAGAVKKCDCCTACEGFWCGTYGGNSGYPGGPGMPCGIIPNNGPLCHPYRCLPHSTCTGTGPGCPACTVIYRVTHNISGTATLQADNGGAGTNCTATVSADATDHTVGPNNVSMTGVGGNFPCGRTAPWVISVGNHGTATCTGGPATPTTAITSSYAHHLATNDLTDNSTTLVIAEQGTQATTQTGPWLRFIVAVAGLCCDSNHFAQVHVYYNLINGTTYARLRGAQNIVPVTITEPLTVSGSLSVSVTPRDYIGACPTGYTITIAASYEASQQTNPGEWNRTADFDLTLDVDIVGLSCSQECSGTDEPEDPTSDDPIEDDFFDYYTDGVGGTDDVFEAMEAIP